MKDIKILLHNFGIESLNQLQEEAVTASQASKNTIVLAPTGSGKTLSFLLPIYQIIEEETQASQVLVISPSRELCLQIQDVWKSLKTGINSVCVYGGHDAETERNALKNKPQLIIGTPGRVNDHVRKGYISPEYLKTLVLDEFDKTLEFGFEPDIKSIYDSLHNIERHLLTSATVINQIPTYLNIENVQFVNHLKDSSTRFNFYTVESSNEEKIESLRSLLSQIANEATLVFCNHRDAVDRLLEHFPKHKWYCDVFHGGLSQFERERALIKFRQGSIKILFVTDLASRGIDIPEIKNAVHFQLPDGQGAFIHRNGRTARFKEATGNIFIINTPNEMPSYFDELTHSPFELLSNKQNITPPIYQSIYISGGKKSKVSKGDILGFLTKTARIPSKDIGKIHILDLASFVAIKREQVEFLLPKFKTARIKKQKLKISVSK